MADNHGLKVRCLGSSVLLSRFLLPWKTRRTATEPVTPSHELYFGLKIGEFGSLQMQTQIEPHVQNGDWWPGSWHNKVVTQQPTYPDGAVLDGVLRELAHLPPLVSSWEIENLKLQLAEATQGKRFLLQGGDCSESFSDCESAAIASKLKILLQMSLVLVQGGKKRVIRIGRFAGQYAKPRSADTET